MSRAELVLNQKPINGYTKKQNAVETSTYGSELAAARIVTEQAIDSRLTLMHMGILVGESVMFGDNELAVKSATGPQ